MRELHINGTKIRQGQHVDLAIPIAKLPSHTLIDLPIFIRSAKEDGPVLLISGGVHGDEINGIVTARRLLGEIDSGLELLRGAVIIIPLVNIYGFLSNSRTFPDGRDLNRSFPGGKKGSLAGRIAHILNEEIIPQIDLGIDFHTGGRMLSNVPQVRADFKDSLSHELAMVFGTEFALNSKLIDKSFRKAAHAAGKSMLVYEGGESMRIDDFSIEEGVSGVKRILKHFGMIQEAPEPRNVRVLSSSSWIRSKASGIFNASIKQGDFVRKGQVLARISDPFGQIKIPVKAPSDGFVIGINNLPVINVGEALFHLGKI